MLEKLFEISLAKFFEREKKNIINGVAERNLCSRLGLYLELEAERERLIGYYADVEYNRKQNGEVKTILDGDYKVIRINCDLILHSRGEIISRDNLIAIEMKKVERPEVEKFNDINRLRAMTKKSYDNVWSFDGQTHPEHVCGYELGYFIEIDNVNNFYKVVKISSGEIINSTNGVF
ncbi:hypothetical protein GJV04_10700 [Enterobacteriaceae bacterium RIT714]|nr:hypothetical protein [Enterobacteriaceae bacterium RIT714]